MPEHTPQVMEVGMPPGAGPGTEAGWPHCREPCSHPSPVCSHPSSSCTTEQCFYNAGLEGCISGFSQPEDSSLNFLSNYFHFLFKIPYYGNQYQATCTDLLQLYIDIPSKSLGIWPQQLTLRQQPITFLPRGAAGGDTDATFWLQRCPQPSGQQHLLLMEK